MRRRRRSMRIRRRWVISRRRWMRSRRRWVRSRRRWMISRRRWSMSLAAGGNPWSDEECQGVLGGTMATSGGEYALIPQH